MPYTVVLMVGQDRVLTETRSQVLRIAGYTVVPAFTLRQAMDEFVSGDFDLVLICHSIPAGCPGTAGGRAPEAHVAYSHYFCGIV